MEHTPCITVLHDRYFRVNTVAKFQERSYKRAEQLAASFPKLSTARVSAHGITSRWHFVHYLGQASHRA